MDKLKTSRSNKNQKNENEESEKENICKRLRKRVNHKFEDTIPELRYILTPEKKEEKNEKQLGFWGKKLKDLETDKEILKPKTELYEFSAGTDDSHSYKSKRKYKPRKKTQPKKQTKETKPEKTTQKKAEIKKKKEFKTPVKENKLISNTENNKKGKTEKFTFSGNTPSIGITSTPATCKINTIEAASFMFLSPVVKEDSAEIPNVLEKIKESISVNNKLSEKTPLKVQKEDNKRVLRSRKLAM